MTTETAVLNQPAWLTSFIPLPSDPAQLTIEDVRTAFVGDWSALKDVVKAAQEVKQQQTHEAG